MRLLPLCMTLALALLTGCQSTPPEKFFVPACTQHRYDAGFCDTPSNFNLFATIVTGRVQ
ncbi:hypothetical protein [Kumtagia ephedrae]|jgi:uncharacterized lipoprotein YajG|uniref:Lipoprotein n=1 Tax=Kumtagia ephedrae TaxID=2116701 RepID=A0A2P7SPG3_9HYPH|nr:hypothetical protein [Mesorhizobium ephedrae]PSJ64265.1 hypothetical protein C7I84_04715 [Mesorhizobium ephedrae]